MLNGEASNVFGLTGLGFEHTIYLTRGELGNNYTSSVAAFESFNWLQAFSKMNLICYMYVWLSELRICVEDEIMSKLCSSFLCLFVLFWECPLNRTFLFLVLGRFLCTTRTINKRSAISWKLCLLISGISPSVVPYLKYKTCTCNIF